MDLLVFSFFLVHISTSVSLPSNTLQYLQLENNENYSQTNFQHFNQEKYVPQVHTPHFKDFYKSSQNIIHERYPQQHPFQKRPKHFHSFHGEGSGPNVVSLHSASVPAIFSSGFDKVDKQMECDGLENLLGDLGIASYALGVLGSFLGFVDILLSLFSQFTSVWSTIASYIFGIIGEIITFIGKTDRLTWIVGNAVNIFGLLATKFGHLGLPFGDVSLAIELVGEPVGVLSVILGTLSTFPEIAKDIMNDTIFQQITGPKFQNFVRTYGC